MADYNLGPDGYLEHIREAKTVLGVPLIASLNGASPGGWVRFAKEIEEAGADALELNVYFLPTDPDVTGAAGRGPVRRDRPGRPRERPHPAGGEDRPVLQRPGRVRPAAVRGGGRRPGAVQPLLPAGLRPEPLEVRPNLRLSTPDELLLRLHWVAILYGQRRGRPGGDRRRPLGRGRAEGDDGRRPRGHDDLGAAPARRRPAAGRSWTTWRVWMEENEYASVRQMQGSMSLRSVGDPAAFERANYMKVLRSYSLRGAVTPALWDTLP